MTVFFTEHQQKSSYTKIYFLKELNNKTQNNYDPIEVPFQKWNMIFSINKVLNVPSVDSQYPILSPASY